MYLVCLRFNWCSSKIKFHYSETVYFDMHCESVGIDSVGLNRVKQIEHGKTGHENSQRNGLHKWLIRYVLL